MFSADESSYGCLTSAAKPSPPSGTWLSGTTNVDYSWKLHEHFQKLRSYRETRFLVDPAGFEVNDEQAEGYREEKIDLPPSWLRGFMQIQSAMSLPMRRVPLRARACKRPRLPQAAPGREESRAVRFELSRAGRWRSCWSPGSNGSRCTIRRMTGRRPRRSGSGAATGCGPWRGSCRCSTRPRSTCSATGCRASGRSGWARCG